MRPGPGMTEDLMGRAYKRGWYDGRKALEQELHEERNQTAIREGRLGLRVDELGAALREALEGDRIDLDRLRGVLEAGLPKGRPVVHDAARHDPEIGSAGWSQRVGGMLQGRHLLCSLSVSHGPGFDWSADVVGMGQLFYSSKGSSVQEALGTVYGMLEAMEDTDGAG